VVVVVVVVVLSEEVLSEESPTQLIIACGAAFAGIPCPLSLVMCHISACKARLDVRFAPQNLNPHQSLTTCLLMHRQSPDYVLCVAACEQSVEEEENRNWNLLLLDIFSLIFVSVSIFLTPSASFSRHAQAFSF